MRGRQKLERLGLLYVPATYDAAHAAGLVVVLHGSGGRAATILHRFERYADGLGLILFAPSADNWSWDLIADNGYGDDVTVIDGALELLFDRYAIDPERVAIAGFSDGASYAISLALGNGHIFRDALVFSGGFAFSTTVRGRPRVFISHGRQDDILPIDKHGRRMRQILERAGLTVRAVEFEGRHELPEEILRQGLETLPAPK